MGEIYYLKRNSENTINNVGIAPYAIQKEDFPCRAYLKSLRSVDNIYIAFLYNTFGRHNKCLKKVLKNEKLRIVEVHLLNEVCVRDSNCSSYEILSGIHKSDLNDKLLNIHKKKNRKLRKKILKNARALSRLLNKHMHENAQCLISPLLESKYVGEDASEKLIRLLKPIFPNCGFVWNSMSLNFMPSNADFLETPHGPRSLSGPTNIANLDGVDIDFFHRSSFEKHRMSEIHIPAFLERNKNNLVTFLWTTECNCNGKVWKDPRGRVCKANKVYKKMREYILKAQNGQL